MEIMQLAVASQRSALKGQPLPFVKTRSNARRFPRRARFAIAGMMMMDAALASMVGSFVVVSSVASLMAASSANDASRQNVIAYTAARQVIENLRTFKAANVPVGTYNDVSCFGAVPQMSLLTSPTATVTISNPRGVLKMAIVTITWQSGAVNRTRSRTLTALFAPNGVAP